MLIWLKHAEHGVKDCYSESEARMCEANGWERFDPAAQVEPKQAEVAPEADLEPQAEPVVAPKKRGRPAKG